MKFKRILDKIEISEERRQELIDTCSVWGTYIYKLGSMNKQEVLELLAYLIRERPYGKSLIKRAIGRFNKLNTVRREHLYEPDNSTGGDTEGSNKVSECESRGSGVGLSRSDAMQELERDFDFLNEAVSSGQREKSTD